jgi:DNA sulfur modification protein DndB
VPEITAPYVEIEQHGRPFVLTRLSVRALGQISYASIRGVDTEPCAVQRILNGRRIASIKEFTLSGGHYPASIVLNWVHASSSIERTPRGLVLPLMERSAQLIDGQHRIAGLKAAMEERPEIGDLQIPTAIYERLSTKECADIFLSINTEQKPVARTLVFDLYGIADEHLVDPAAARARDIVMALHEDEDSPYRDQIKLPGSARRRGGIALSTAVSAIKPLVEDKGDFEQRGILELETQKKIVKNVFSALADKYREDWDDTSNAFMYASGFVGAIDFLRTRLLSYGHNKSSFTKQLFSDAIHMLPSDLVLQVEVKGKGGKDAPGVIMQRLNAMFVPNISTATAFEV